MKFIFEAGFHKFYWEEFGGNVLHTTDDKSFEVIGNEDTLQEAVECAIEWL